MMAHGEPKREDRVTRLEEFLTMARLADQRADATGKRQFVVDSPAGYCVVGVGETTPANEASALYVAFTGDLADETVSQQLRAQVASRKTAGK